MIRVTFLIPCVESQEKEDRQREAGRPGSGRELSAGGAAGGRASSEAVWNESGVCGGAGGQTEGGRKDIKAKGAGGAGHMVTGVRAGAGRNWNDCSSIVLCINRKVKMYRLCTDK